MRHGGLQPVGELPGPRPFTCGLDTKARRQMFSVSPAEAASGFVPLLAPSGSPNRTPPPPRAQVASQWGPSRRSR